jgi:hypothetical protein
MKSISSSKRKVIDLDEDEYLNNMATPSPSKRVKKEHEEKRLKLFRKKAPQSFLEKLERAQTQRQDLPHPLAGSANAYAE